MYCSQCGYDNPVSVKFCNHCELESGTSPVHPEHDDNLSVLIYSGFWVRFLAAFLDFLVLVAIAILLILVIAGLVAYTGRDDILHDRLTVSLFYGGIICMAAAYHILMVSGSQSATFGKRWMNIKVLDSNGNGLSAPRASWRLMARLLSHLLIQIGFLIQPFTPRKQALHDLLADTVVVRTNESSTISIKATLLVLFFALIMPVLAFISIAGLPILQQHILKVQLDHGVQTGKDATLAVAQFYRKNGRVPVAMSEIDGNFSTSPHVRGIEINQQNGETTIILSELARKAIRSRHLIFTPTIETSLAITWKCYSNDIDISFLPETCK